MDIGARVKKGQLLAEIETPELDQQLRQARANLSAAEANLNLANITATRNENLLKSDSVSRQERDNAVTARASAQSAVEASRANVARLEQLQSFERIFAPFDGITLLFRSEGPRVGIVRNRKVELAPITIGRDYGNFVEIVSGLQANDDVILDPSDSLSDGAAVTTKGRSAAWELTKLAHLGKRTGRPVAVEEDAP